MKMPNGFGSVYKLSGKRRRPWAARKTIGWNCNEDTLKVSPIYQFIGYYSTRQEALTALIEYNKDPYDLHHDTITFEEVYEKWSQEHFKKVSHSNVQGYRAAYRLCGSISKMRIRDVKLDHLQRIVDESGKNFPTLRKLKVLFGLVFDYAVMHEIVTPDRRDIVRYVDISQAGNPNGFDRKPFTKKEIKLLWDSVDSNEYIQIPLMLIYSGLRIGELYNLNKKDVHLEERWLYVREAKTDSGIREVPISEKIVPFIEHWMTKDSEWLICNRQGGKFLDKNFRDAYWKPVMEVLNMNHKPHDTRHTCVSLLAEVGVDERIIKKIVGHKGQGVTETIYTHLELPIKLDAINKI